MRSAIVPLTLFSSSNISDIGSDQSGRDAAPVAGHVAMGAGGPTATADPWSSIATSSLISMEDGRASLIARSSCSSLAILASVYAVSFSIVAQNASIHVPVVLQAQKGERRAHGVYAIFLAVDPQFLLRTPLIPLLAMSNRLVCGGWSWCASPKFALWG